MRNFKKWLLAFALAANSVGFAFAEGSYGLPQAIQDGNILHCFNWTMTEVKAELPNIAAAGFGSVQLSPLQRPDIKKGSSTWHDLYRPYDLAFKASEMGSEDDLKALCDEAAKYGIKVIVDVVANHVDKTAGYHDTWWDSNGRVRWEGGISDWNHRYSVTHGQLGDYGDINSEDSEVQARGKVYVEKLQSLGVKGIRWDAAKHIGLPSENCGFWSTVTSVPGMWHYGEILDSPGGNDALIKEYAKYISVTDNKYSDGAAKDNDGIPYGYGGAWVIDQQLPDTKMVYWGESHDTYSNPEGWSKNKDQATIDRAYASMACRNGATCLYLARPDSKDFNGIKVGKGSNESYKGKAVTEVNKFRNAMTGKADWCEKTDNAFSVTRQDGGAVIVMKGSGNVSIANGGGYCPAGTYTDRVSGGTFTVTSTTISGNVGQSGIAVIYNDGIVVNPNPDPEPDPEPDNGTTVYYDNSSTNWDVVYCYEWTGDDKNAAWPGVEMTKVKDNIYSYTCDVTYANVIFNNNTTKDNQTADLKLEDKHIYSKDGSHKLYEEEVVDPDPEPNPEPDPAEGCKVYYNNGESQWMYVYCYAWTGENYNAAWPGVEMTKEYGSLYSYTTSAAYENVIFSNGSGAQTADLSFVNNNVYKNDGQDQDKNTIKSYDIEHTPTTIYYDNSETLWDEVYCYQWTDDIWYAPFPGEQMQLMGSMTRAENNVYTYTAPVAMKSVIFTNGKTGEDEAKTPDCELADSHIYAKDGTHELYTVITSIGGIEADSAQPVEYYNLQGVRIQSAVPGTIVIERRGDKVCKKIYR